jgi:hypothetical protein
VAARLDKASNACLLKRLSGMNSVPTMKWILNTVWKEAGQKQPVGRSERRKLGTSIVVIIRHTMHHRGRA